MRERISTIPPGATDFTAEDPEQIAQGAPLAFSPAAFRFRSRGDRTTLEGAVVRQLYCLRRKNRKAQSEPLS